MTKKKLDMFRKLAGDFDFLIDAAKLKSKIVYEEEVRDALVHISGKFPKGHKCSEKCDQVKLYEYLNKKI